MKWPFLFHADPFFLIVGTGWLKSAAWVSAENPQGGRGQKVTGEEVIVAVVIVGSGSSSSSGSNNGSGGGITDCR